MQHDHPDLPPAAPELEPLGPGPANETGYEGERGAEDGETGGRDSSNPAPHKAVPATAARGWDSESAHRDDAVRGHGWAPQGVQSDPAGSVEVDADFKRWRAEKIAEVERKYRAWRQERLRRQAALDQAKTAARGEDARSDDESPPPRGL